MPTTSKKAHVARARRTPKRPLREQLNDSPDAVDVLRAQVDVKPQAKLRADRVLDEIAARLATVKMLRQLAEMTQTDLAAATGMAQPEISAMEQRSDILLSTLRRVVEATGGELQVVVRLPAAALTVVVDEVTTST